MKKKRLLIGLCTTLMLWLAVGITDLWRVSRFELPVFCVLTNGADDGGSGDYVGLGYSFEIRGNFMPEDEFPGVTQYTYRIFGMDVKSGIRD